MEYLKIKGVYMFFCFPLLLRTETLWFMYGDTDCNKNCAYKMPFIQGPFMQLKA